MQTSTARKTAYNLSVKRAGYLAVALVSVVTLVLSVRMLMSDINSYEASLFVEHWNAKGEVSDTAWPIALEAAESAVHQFPVANGQAYDRLGKVYEWQHLYALPGSSAAEESRKLALQAYRNAVAVRPDWPYTWNRIAWVKWQLLEIDSEFDLALKTSLAKGPWRWRSNQSLVELGFMAWYKLTTDQKALIATALDNLRQVKPGLAKKLLARAQTLGLGDELQALMPVAET